jgi:hypothetical protein
VATPFLDSDVFPFLPAFNESQAKSRGCPCAFNVHNVHYVHHFLSLGAPSAHHIEGLRFIIVCYLIQCGVLVLQRKLLKVKSACETEFFAENTRRTAMPGLERRRRSNTPSVDPELRCNLVDFPLHTLCEPHTTPPMANSRGAEARAFQYQPGLLCAESELI